MLQSSLFWKFGKTGVVKNCYLVFEIKSGSSADLFSYSFFSFFLTVHDCDNSMKHFVKGCGSMFIMYSIDSLVGTLTLVKTDFNIISAENVYRLDSQDSL